MSNPEEPRFGQRSDSWSSNPDPSGTTGGSQTPWPQYGESAAPSAGQQSAGASYPGAASPYGGPASGQAPQSQTPYPAQPQSPYPGQGGAVAKLPGRGGAIALLIIGGVLAFIAAPIVFLGSMVSGINWDQLVVDAMPISSGSTVTVGEDGSVVIFGASGETGADCVLEDSAGRQTPLIESQELGGALVAEGMDPGPHTLTCTETTSQFFAMPKGQFEDLVSSMIGGVGQGLLWATLVGVVGVGMLIGGIVMLVSVNRRRREIQRQSWAGGPTAY